MNDFMKLTGQLQIYKNGELVRDIPNLVVTAGKVWLMTLAQSGSGTPMSHMAVGTGTTAAAITDTILETENARVALTVAGGTRTNASISFEGVFPAGTGTATLTEAGILNAASTGTLLARTVFSAISKGASDSLTITWTVSLS